jgi:hypothetical protein
MSAYCCLTRAASSSLCRPCDFVVPAVAAETDRLLLFRVDFLGEDLCRKNNLYWLCHNSECMQIFKIDKMMS